MSFPTDSTNPYEAPTVNSSLASLADDTEFLFNDKVVAGIGKITLPEICVITGARDDLFRRTSKFYWCSRWISVSRNILLFLSFIVLIQSQVAGIGPPVTGGIGGLLNMVKLAFAWTIIAGAVVFVVLNWVLRETIAVEWSISRAAVKKYRRIWIVGILAAVGLMAASEYAVSFLGFPRFLTMFLVAMCISIASLYAKSAGQDPLAVLGRHDGLFLIGGFREPFSKKVERLAALRSSRESAAAPKPD